MFHQFKYTVPILMLVLTILMPVPCLSADTPPLPPKNPLRDNAQTSKQPETNQQEKKVEEPEEWSKEELIKAQKKCSSLLAKFSLEFVPAPPIRKGQCGTPAPLKVTSIGAGKSQVSLSPYAIVNCPLAAALNNWLHKIVQPTAKKMFKDRVTDLRVVAHYACRRRYGNPKKRMSEHAFANAIDIAAIRFENNEWLTILDGWGPTERDIQKEIKALQEEAEKERLAKAEEEAEKAKTSSSKTAPGGKDPVEASNQKSSTADEKRNDDRESSRNSSTTGAARKKEKHSQQPDLPIRFKRPKLDKRARFLRIIHSRACGLFGTVLGPEANDAHKDHFHLDLAPRKRRAFCE